MTRPNRRAVARGLARRRPRVVARGPILTALLVSALAPPPRAAAQNPDYEELQTFTAVLNHVRLNYVDSVSYRDMVRAAIDGVLRSLDPHSYFVERAAWDRRDALEAGEAGWCGVDLADVGGRVVVLGVAPGGPADDAGVMAGDRLLQVADSSIAGLGAPRVELELIGGLGSTIALTLERGPRFDADTFRVELRREALETSSVGDVLQLDHTTGFVRLTRFRGDAEHELRDAIEALRDDGVRSLVLDLRGNPGGRLDVALGVAGLFLPAGAPVYRLRGRKADTRSDGITRSAGPFRDMPLVVLVDVSSASAAEAVAAALQDHGRATIVGRRTFGKALAQTAFFLPRGDVVWLTIGHVLTPDGRSLQREYRNRQAEAYVEDAGTASGDGPAGPAFAEEGGGVVPDVPVEGYAALPAWWSAALENGLHIAVADSVAAGLGASVEARAEWLTNPDLWEASLVAPFLASVRGTLGDVPEPGPAAGRHMALDLALRAAIVRWGRDAAVQILLATDPDVDAALEVLRR